MAVREQPRVFKTSDGTEHPTKAAAERHEAKLTAVDEFNKAKRALAHTTVKASLTADGELFEWDRWGHHWVIADTWGWPELYKVQLNGWYSQEFDIEEDGELVILEPSRGDRKSRYRVGELYQNETAAKQSLLKAREERMAKYAESIEELKAEIAGKKGT